MRKNDASRHSPYCICSVGESFSCVLQPRGYERPGLVGADLRVYDYFPALFDTSSHMRPSCLTHVSSPRCDCPVAPCVSMYMLRVEVSSPPNELRLSRRSATFSCYAQPYFVCIMTLWKYRIRRLYSEFDNVAYVTPVYLPPLIYRLVGTRTFSCSQAGYSDVLPYAAIRISQAISAYLFRHFTMCGVSLKIAKIRDATDNASYRIIYPPSAENPIGLRYPVRLKFVGGDLHMLSASVEFVSAQLIGDAGGN